MIKKIFTLSLFAINTPFFGQNLDSLIKSYNPSQDSLIERNWSQFFKEDISPLYKTKNLYSIRLDSYGLIFPFKDVFKNVSTQDMKCNGQRAIKHTKYSIVNIFGRYPGKLQKHTLGVIDNENLFYDSLIGAIHECKKLNLENFNEQWRKFHNPRTITEINNLIDLKGYEKIVFYCHGYNVPYSLAALQFEYLIEDFHLDDSKTLFIPVYWPSNDAKNYKLNKDKTLNYTDKKTPNNAVRFLYYSNEAYFAGLTLRAIINGLNENVSIKIVSHSLGVTVSTTALINTKSKLQPHNYAPINDQLCALMDSTPIPNRPIAVYMSAAAIPGIGTFQNTDLSKAKHFTFYCSWNANDHVLNKDFVHIKVGPNKLGGTELGLNANNSVEDVEKLLNSNSPGSFEKKNVTAQTDHDIFSYLRNPAYRNFMAEFFNRRYE